MFDIISEIILKIEKVDIFIVNIHGWFTFMYHDSMFENVHFTYHINWIVKKWKIKKRNYK